MPDGSTLQVCRDGEAPRRPGAVAAIGNFDGVHRGHRSLLDITRAEAARRGVPAAVLTFEPHPRDFFRPQDPGFRLTSETAKLKILARFGIDIVFVRRFDAALAATSAAEFVSRILKDELQLSAVVIGHDFHFGRGREGTPALLTELGAAAGIDILVQDAVAGGGAPVSSTRIRAALAAGDIAAAEELLGYRWFVEGTVRHGEKLGRTLGFPTANIALPAGCRLRHGIYAVRVATAPGTIHDGVASFGRRPTFDNGAPLLETFLFDFAGDLYGQSIEVEFLDWIRPEEKFASAEDLVVAMNRDAARARAIAAAPRSAPSLIG
ncbi:bifunctional riboflavin kinase/FAD synthetase [Enterovirga rhinocerotis]|uniref:Riboflavin biosynthesis protein n=1 Tax=Enterovirga rhinocerotis TaxID=1339210 RepID=A0A4R7BQV5_9HYPH|nr:bifunctional riboflavin kinase/FAD synthetase [Enterovirga rhinocerotis]TDR88018.1 riboflavin kinase/FMN adenylyltransferase [Enterovirga rhinocerotis]